MRWLLAPLLLALACPAAAQAVTSRVVAEADGSRTLVHETRVAAPPARVWEAISTAEGWRGWAVPVAWSPDPATIETSYDTAAKPGDPSTIRQRILGAIPGRLLVFATVKAPQGFPDFETYSKVVNFFELEPVEGGTRVRLTQTGYPRTEAGDRLLGFFEKGNAETLALLRERLGARAD